MACTRVADIPIVPLSNSKFSQLRNLDDVNCPTGGTPELGDKHDDSAVMRQAYTGMCDRFDLSLEEDRKKYADLVSKLYSGTEYCRLWEERMPAQDGKYFVYVAYVQVMNVYQTGNDRFDLNDKR